MADTEKRYYSVVCKCGHVGGNKYYIPIEFAVVATSKKEAAEKARLIPRCKHHQKDCILQVKEISHDEFRNINGKNRNDPYLSCHSIQEQRQYYLDDRICKENSVNNYLYKRNKEKSTFMFGKKNVRHPKQYMRNVYKMQEAYSY